jgi:hypothetical protein
MHPAMQGTLARIEPSFLGCWGRPFRPGEFEAWPSAASREQIAYGHRLPFAAARCATPRAFNASAMARNTVAPARCISRMIGRTFAE